MNTIDIIIAVILLYALIKGWVSGIIVQLAGIAGILAGIWAASRFSDKMAELLGMDNANEQVMYIVTLVVVMVLVIILLKFINRLLSGVGLSVVLNIFGVIFSVGKWLLILALVLSVYQSVAKTFNFKVADMVKESIFYEPLTTIEKNVFPYIKDITDKVPEINTDNLKTI